MKTIWLTILLIGCGQEPATDEATNEPAEEKGGTPAETSEPKVDEVAEDAPPATPALPSTLVDAKGTKIGPMDSNQVVVQGQHLDVKVHQGFTASSDQAICYFKQASCEGDCYTSSNSTAIVLDNSTLLIATPELKKDVTISGPGAPLPWLSQTSPDGCIESTQEKATAGEKLFLAKPVKYELPFALEK